MRLTHRDKYGRWCSDGSKASLRLGNPSENYPAILWGDAVNKLAAYEEAEEQGGLVILPCKVGDTVWSRVVEPWTVVSVEWFSRKVTQLHCKSPVTGRGMTFSVGKRSLGKTVFLTREEAESAKNGGQEDGT